MFSSVIHLIVLVRMSMCVDVLSNVLRQKQDVERNETNLGINGILAESQCNCYAFPAKLVKRSNHG